MNENRHKFFVVDSFLFSVLLFSIINSFQTRLSYRSIALKLSSTWKLFLYFFISFFIYYLEWETNNPIRFVNQFIIE